MSVRFAAAALTLVALLCACAGGGSGANVLEPATPSPQPTLKPYVPNEEPTPRVPAGRVTTQLTASCTLSTVDAVISARYRANVTGGDTFLRRVRLTVNNKMADDSGEIYTTTFDKEVKLHVASGANYNLRISYIAPNAIGPQILNIVSCPSSPGPKA